MKKADDVFKDSKTILQSTWTPLGNDEANSKVYADRKQLVLKWFDKWNDNQRREFFDEILHHCKINQLKYLKSQVQQKLPTDYVDFTRFLPRVACLYILSFLDPRSLCRASQVCWYWKYLCDSNEIWAPKCARLGWFANGPLGANNEPGIWKKHYLDNIVYLQVTRPAKLLRQRANALQQKQMKAEKEKEHKKKEEEKRKAEERAIRERLNSVEIIRKTTPWRGPSRTPTDTRRNNYLDNEAEFDKARKPSSKCQSKSGKKSAETAIGMKDITQQLARTLIAETVLKIKKEEPNQADELESVPNPVEMSPIPLDRAQHREAFTKKSKHSLSQEIENENGLDLQQQPWQLIEAEDSIED